mmetsp:Transcript_30586/g.46932  ORF Transcript_30586/g.46932 Transcript_30586/m.46932 type:complete len:208 (-) Transcript_30586:139-762(-)
MQLSSYSNGDCQGKTLKRVSFTEDPRIHTFSSSLESITIDCPNNDEYNDMDVLLGKGKRAINHTGNVKLKYIINMNKDNYEMLNKQEKTRLCRKIVESIRNNGGRFLIFNSESGLYEEAADCLAHEKVSHHLRAKNKKPRRKNKKTRTKSSSTISRRVVQTSSNASEHFVDIDILKGLLASQQRDFAKMLTNEPFSEDEATNLLVEC